MDIERKGGDCTTSPKWLLARVETIGRAIFLLSKRTMIKNPPRSDHQWKTILGWEVNFRQNPNRPFSIWQNFWWLLCFLLGGSVARFQIQIGELGALSRGTAPPRTTLFCPKKYASNFVSFFLSHFSFFSCIYQIFYKGKIVNIWVKILVIFCKNSCCWPCDRHELSLACRVC